MQGRREGRPSETIKLSILGAGLTDHESCFETRRDAEINIRHPLWHFYGHFQNIHMW